MKTFLNQSEHRGNLIVLGLQDHPDSLRRLRMGQCPSDSEKPRDSSSPHLHNEEELDNFVFK
jgi:hypothetical protein